MRRLLAAAVLMAALAVTGCGGGRSETVAKPSPDTRSTFFASCPLPVGPARGTPTLPAVSLSCADGSGRPVRLDRAFGHPTVINLWASWCGPCRQELPEIQRYSDEHPDVLVLTVDTGDTREAGSSFARDAKVSLPTLFDGDKKLLSGIGRSALPVTLLVTAEGRLVYTYNGTALTAAALGALVHRYLS